MPSEIEKRSPGRKTKRFITCRWLLDGIHSARDIYRPPDHHHSSFFGDEEIDVVQQIGLFFQCNFSSALSSYENALSVSAQCEALSLPSAVDPPSKLRTRFKIVLEFSRAGQGMTPWSNSSVLICKVRLSRLTIY